MNFFINQADLMHLNIPMVLVLYFLAAIPASYAEVLSDPAMADAVSVHGVSRIPDKGEVKDFDREYLEIRLKMEAPRLRQKKEANIRRKRKEYIRNVELLYKKAVDFYRQKRFDRARDTFSQVEYLMTCYRSTCEYLERIDRRLAQRPTQGIEQQGEPVEDFQRMNDVVERAERLTALLVEAGQGEDAAAVKRGSGAFAKVLNKLKQERTRYFQQLDIQALLDQMEQAAAASYEKILELIESGDYMAAEKEHDSFLARTRARLEAFKKIIVLRDKVLGGKSPGP